MLSKEAKIVIVGDAMLDRYLVGQANRISPEAPVPVLRVRSSREVPGGAANVALNIAALGGKVTLVSYVGADDDAGCLSRILESAGVRCRFLTATHSRTIVKLRALSMHQQMLRLDFEDDFACEDHAALHALLADELVDARALVLSDYAKGTLADVKPMIEMARSSGIPTIVDPKGSDFQRYAGAAIITPNESEFRQASGYAAQEGDAALEMQARTFRESVNVENLLVTRGERGMMLVGPTAPARFIATEAKDVFDVTGAGDTVIGVLALGLASDMSLVDAMVLANRAAGIVVGRHGTAAVTHEDLFGGTEGDALTEIRAAQRSGDRIVMTNGCFDVLHAGHVQYLEEARKLGDRLVVALNSDASVRRLKGASRPVNNFEHRRTVLAALRAVDWVIGFGDDDDADRDTPRAIITRVAPDVLVKGADYTIDTIVGANEVLLRGGEVRTLDLVAGLSTTELLRRQQVADASIKESGQ
ncbi:bifunctional D-glycero-beta-D-manno-heptose-7-phosphate kinase/D-glycero-beta-D-manno-heptose 1-phosphate adenylyltransferase HldE [Sphingomonas yabuuchiae]|uniref:bifunctional D-glycero-beta-D-manno-heptose-7-phosphate kinase/D-glycero-beta-D-manno-heptose 1-phosphate adenylyltransferase HldE n=1 Tax=Sphingomonas yabuuchiae TaxID=172044 RepID=UPI003D973804